MIFNNSGLPVLRKRAFTSWEEIAEAALERRRHIHAVWAERKDWFEILWANVGREE